MEWGSDINQDWGFSNTYLLFSTQESAEAANNRITENMAIPEGSLTSTWDSPFEVVGGDYAGYWAVKKPDEMVVNLMQGVTVELEAEYEPIWVGEI